MSRSNSASGRLTNWLLKQHPALVAKLPAFIALTRADRPIGILLLLWPTITALWIAGEGSPDLALLAIFVSGTAVMRSAGCCINDFADYNIDDKVARTRNRPLATGQLSRKEAAGCFAVLSFIGLILVLMTNYLTFVLSFGAIAVASLYPFMKRFTHLPQLVLGVAFSWGILMAFSAQTNSIPAPAYLLFLANVLWTVAYDTEYAMVDREFDLKIGVKSTAILFGDLDRFCIGLLQLLFIATLWFAGLQLELGMSFTIGLVAASALLIHQQLLIRNRQPEACFRAFLNNNWVGAVIFVGLVVDYLRAG